MKNETVSYETTWSVLINIYVTELCKVGKPEKYLKNNDLKFSSYDGTQNQDIQWFPSIRIVKKMTSKHVIIQPFKTDKGKISKTRRENRLHTWRKTKMHG